MFLCVDHRRKCILFPKKSLPSKCRRRKTANLKTPFFSALNISLPFKTIFPHLLFLFCSSFFMLPFLSPAAPVQLLRPIRIRTSGKMPHFACLKYSRCFHSVVMSVLAQLKTVDAHSYTGSRSPPVHMVGFFLSICTGSGALTYFVNPFRNIQIRPKTEQSPGD